MGEKQLRVAVKVRVFSGDEKCFGTGVAELLEQVDRLHSLRQATFAMEMAYSKAWRVLKAAEEGLGFPLLESTTGGKGGGGARLTEQGRRFLETYRRYEQAVRDFADEAFVEFFSA